MGAQKILSGEVASKRAKRVLYPLLIVSLLISFLPLFARRLLAIPDSPVAHPTRQVIRWLSMVTRFTFRLVSIGLATRKSSFLLLALQHGSSHEDIFFAREI
jgi:hypothetical protein